MSEKVFIIVLLLAVVWAHITLLGLRQLERDCLAAERFVSVDHAALNSQLAACFDEDVTNYIGLRLKSDCYLVNCVTMASMLQTSKELRSGRNPLEQKAIVLLLGVQIPNPAKIIAIADRCGALTTGISLQNTR